MAAVSHDRDKVAFYDAATGQSRQRIPGKQCRAAAFSPDARWLAFTVGDNAVLWDWPQRRQARVLTGHTSTVTSLAFSPGNRTLATAGNDRPIRLWQPATGQLLHTMTGHTGDIRDITFVDNDRLISIDNPGNLHVWHVLQGELICAFQIAPKPAHHLAVSPYGRHLVLCLDNGQVELPGISRP